MTVNGFVRYTHDENNEYRDLPNWKNRDIGDGYIHMLGPEPVDFIGLVKNVFNYNEQYPEDPFIEDIFYIALQLLNMLEADMVRVVPL